MTATALRFFDVQVSEALQAPTTAIHAVEDISAIVVRAFDSLYADAPLIHKCLGSPVTRSLTRVGFEVC